MKIDGLKGLYRSMKQQGVERYNFDFKFRNVSFDVFYFLDDVPNILMFGMKHHNFYFEIPVRKGFEIIPKLDDKYHEFCRLMGFNYNSANPFKPSYLFAEFNNHIPQTASISNIPKPSKIAKYRNDVEEADKIYYIGWKDNTKTGQSVRTKNLDKTRKLLSYEAYLRCKSKNISSRWSLNEKDEKPYHLP